jgi:O-antigen ligase
LAKLIRDLKDNRWIFLISLLFIAINLVAISQDVYVQFALPVVLLMFLLAIYRYDYVLLITVFFVPPSMQIVDLVESSSFNLYLPTEPLLLGLTFLFLFKQLHKQILDKRILWHPVTKAIIFYLVWIFVTSLTSTMPVVSFKFLLSNIWFIVPFYFITAQMMRNKKLIPVYAWLYIISMSGVMAWTISRHFSYGIYNSQAAHWVMTPIFNDHTSYGAAIAFCIPVLAGFFYAYAKNPLTKMLVGGVLLYFIFALVLSYSRAAWLSVIGAIGLFFLIKFRINYKYVLLGLGILIGGFFYLQHQIEDKLGKNEQDSSEKLAEHVQSISNISTDASNVERLNRWSSAIRMFKEKPFFGFGPGTYMFKYAPYQKSSEKSYISTNSGDMGNAHSDYLGPLAERGFIGTLSYVFIVIAILYTGITTYYKLEDHDLKVLCMTFLMGIFTYIIHGFLNNFLDTDKISALFWGYTGILVALNVYHIPGRNKEVLS